MLAYKYLFKSLLSIPLGVYLGVELLGHVRITCFPKWLHHFTFTPAMYENSNFSTSSLTLGIPCVCSKYSQPGTSLVVQWVRLHAPNAGDPGLIPGRGNRSRMHAATKIPRAATKKKIPRATTKAWHSQKIKIKIK